MFVSVQKEPCVTVVRSTHWSRRGTCLALLIDLLTDYPSLHLGEVRRVAPWLILVSYGNVCPIPWSCSYYFVESRGYHMGCTPGTSSRLVRRLYIGIVR